jgi:hypothetical protein
LNDCGTACGALHSKDDAELPLYFFLDPTRWSDASEDCFIFSKDNGRIDYGESRPLLATLESSFRLEGEEREKTVNAFVPHVAVPVHGSASFKTDALGTGAASYSLPAEPLSLSRSMGECKCVQALLSAQVEAASVTDETMWTSDWTDVDLLHEGPEVFEKLAWITGRLKRLQVLKTWMSLSSEDKVRVDPRIFLHNTDYSLVFLKELVCPRCCPVSPQLSWKKNSKNMMVPREDGLQASKFEAALKNRPAPFVVQLRKDGALAQFRIALNVATMAHKAQARLPLPPPDVTSEDVTVSWRLSATEAFDPLFGHQVSTTFKLSSNRSASA